MRNTQFVTSNMQTVGTGVLGSRPNLQSFHMSGQATLPSMPNKEIIMRLKVRRWKVVQQSNGRGNSTEIYQGHRDEKNKCGESSEL
jgi:hypothetical protein